MNDEDIVCYCLGVSVKDIKDAIASGCQNFAQVQEKTGAGTVCGACNDEVEALVAQLLKQK